MKYRTKVSDLAYDLGLTPTTVHNWCKLAGIDTSKGLLSESVHRITRMNKLRLTGDYTTQGFVKFSENY